MHIWIWTVMCEAVPGASTIVTEKSIGQGYTELNSLSTQMQEEPCWIQPKVHLIQYSASCTGQPNAFGNPISRIKEELQPPSTATPQQLIFNGILPLNMEAPYCHHKQQPFTDLFYEFVLRPFQNYLN